MDVVNAEQARIAEEAGACAVMALERVPADIRAQGGVARMRLGAALSPFHPCISDNVVSSSATQR